MKLPRLRTIVLVPLVAFALFYIAGVIVFALRETPELPSVDAPVAPLTIAILGASGTAGDGILEAALASPDIEKIHVITRRLTPRIERGVTSGKVQMTLHMDYLDFAAVSETLAEVDAVFWAIGLRSWGVDEETYAMIHVDFPLAFVRDWSAVIGNSPVSFHYISSSDISEESTAMWAREKLRAEKLLTAFAADTNMRVIAYRPDYIGPSDEEASLGQILLYNFFKPVGAAVKAMQIGQAMIEVSARPAEFPNGAKLHTGKITRYSEAYEQRRTNPVNMYPMQN